jgi:hypothetical protein
MGNPLHALQIFGLVVVVSLSVTTRAHAQDTREDYERAGLTPPKAITDEERVRMTEQQRQQKMSERLTRYRSGRVSTDVDPAMSGKTRFSRILEMHQDEDHGGVLEHANPSSDMERALVHAADTGQFTVQVRGLDVLTVKGKSVYNYEIIHNTDTFPTGARDADGKEIAAPATSTEDYIRKKRKQLTGASIDDPITDQDVFLIEAKTHTRRVAKQIARDEAAQAGKNYAAAAVLEAKDCDYQDPKEDRTKCKAENFANADMVYEEAEWLKKYYETEKKNQFVKRAVERFNEGADANQAKSRTIVDDPKDPKAKEKIQENLALNRNMAGNSDGAFMTYKKELLNPDFSVSELNRADVGSLVRLQSGALWKALRKQVTFDVEQSIPAPRRDDFAPDKAGDKTYDAAVAKRDADVKAAVDDRLKKVLANPEEELKNITLKKDGVEFHLRATDVRALMTSAQAAHSDCASPMSICAYDPESGALKPAATYYNNKDYGAYVNMLDELVKRESYAVSQDPSAAIKGAGISSADYISGEADNRAQVAAQFRSQLRDMQNLLIAQRDSMAQWIAASGGDVSALPPFPSAEELSLSVVYGKSLDDYGPTRQSGQIKKATETAGDSSTGAYNAINLRANNKKIVDGAPLTPSGVDASPARQAPARGVASPATSGNPVGGGAGIPSPLGK